MRSTSFFVITFAALALGGCPNTGGGDGLRDMSMPVDMPGTDSGPRDMGGTPDLGAPTSLTMAQVVNPADAMHPRFNTNVTITGNLVALTPRLFISQSTTTGKCLFAVWVGTTAGGDFSGIEVIDSFLPPGGMTGDCFMAPPNVLPDTVAIGSAVTALTGIYDEFCPSGSTCPPGTSQQLEVTSGTFTISGMASVPAPADVMAADVSAMGATPAPRDMALQGSLVRLSGTTLQVAPSAANHNNMEVSTGSTATPTMIVSVTKYSGVGCQRTILSAMTAGDTVGDVTGVLSYSFGQWVLQPRTPADFPGIVCPMDGGVMDAGGSADAATD